MKFHGGMEQEISLGEPVDLSVLRNFHHAGDHIYQFPKIVTLSYKGKIGIPVRAEGRVKCEKLKCTLYLFNSHDTVPKNINFLTNIILYCDLFLYIMPL